MVALVGEWFKSKLENEVENTTHLASNSQK